MQLKGGLGARCRRQEQKDRRISTAAEQSLGWRGSCSRMAEQRTEQKEGEEGWDTVAVRLSRVPADEQQRQLCCNQACWKPARGRSLAWFHAQQVLHGISCSLQVPNCYGAGLANISSKPYKSLERQCNQLSRALASQSDEA